MAISGGYKDQLKWEDRLEFKRISWYQELSLVFDVLITPVSDTSPFQNWFSAGEKRMIAPCKDFYLVLTYALDEKKISEGTFRDQMAKLGYDQWALPDFSAYLVNHPDYERLAMKLYHLHGFCRVSEKAEQGPLVIRFPNFPEKNLNP